MTDYPTIDTGIYFGCTPPIIIPLSARAKEKIKCKEGEGVIFLDADAESVLTQFPGEWIMGVVEEYTGDVIHVMSIKVLH